MAVYYIDSSLGKPENDGLSELSPKSSYRELAIAPGDTILFKAGSVYRDAIQSPNGEEGKLITWDMYGEGEKPLFLGSVNLHDKALWTEKEKNIWACSYDFKTDVCNIVFGDDEECGVLAWEYEDLNAKGKWHFTYMGYFGNGAGRIPEHIEKQGKVLYLYCEGNPAEVYSNIECALYGCRFLLSGNRYIRFNNIAGKYSGVHVYGQSNVKDVKISNCDFRFIGGCVWDRIQRIRFGNGVEVWEYGEDLTLENSYFDQVYDSCTTHQGFINERPCLRINIINNVFKNYGMAAYELRDLIALDTHFDGNTCIGAGRGFSLQGETPPRKSELWPQPMGHHLFFWRIYGPTENGCITVRNNVFHDAPYGAAVYSTIHPDAEAQVVFENNTYYKDEEDYLIRLGGKNYGKNEFALYQKEQNQDKGSKVEKVY